MLGMRELARKFSGVLVISEMDLANLFDTNLTQVQKWKRELQDQKFLDWERIGPNHVKYYFDVPKDYLETLSKINILPESPFSEEGSESNMDFMSILKAKSPNFGSVETKVKNMIKTKNSLHIEVCKALISEKLLASGSEVGKTQKETQKIVSEAEEILPETHGVVKKGHEVGKKSLKEDLSHSYSRREYSFNRSSNLKKEKKKRKEKILDLRERSKGEILERDLRERSRGEIERRDQNSGLNVELLKRSFSSESKSGSGRLEKRILDHWNSKNNVVHHIQKGTSIRSLALKAAKKVLGSKSFTIEEIMAAIDNYDHMLGNRSEFRIFTKAKMCLADFLVPGMYSMYLSSSNLPQLWLKTCLPKNAPLTTFSKKNSPVWLNGDPNPDLTKMFVQAKNQTPSKTKFALTNLTPSQQKSLISVIEKIRDLAKVQPKNSNGSSFETNFIHASQHCLEAASDYFGRWRGMENGGVITPNMLKFPKFWKEGFPQYERENHHVNGIQFPRSFLEKVD